MSADPLSDVVSGQYEKWTYPAPILDLPGWLQSSWQWFDPSHSHRVMWPDSDYREGLDILIAGCGTNQAAVFAFTNPTARVVAIDVSAASLDHSRYLADKYGLKNLELHRLPIEEVASLQGDFDLIVTTGVLHHLADPAVGMSALARCLRPDGVLAVMLYAKYGRIGVDMMQSVFRDLGLRQDEASLAVVRDAVGQLPPDHPVRSYLTVAPDVVYDAGLVDTFLHGREQAYTIEECIDLVTDSGLVFQDLFLKSSYHPPLPPQGTFQEAVSALPREQQWAVMERVNARNACHFFLACRPERPASSYVIDFSVETAPAYVPSLRHGCRLVDRSLSRSGWSLPLDDLQFAVVSRIDGKTSIADLGQWVGGVDAARAVVESLWRRDFLAVGL